MKKLLLALGLFLSTQTNASEWELYGSPTDESFKVYFSPSSIKKLDDEKVRVWWMVDYVEPPTGRSLLSVKYLDYIDCINETNTIVSLVEYSGQMGSGTAIFRDDFPEAYKHISPGSLDDLLMKKACHSEQ